jgi:hypothetical protein
MGVDRQFELQKLEIEHRFQAAKHQMDQALEKEKLDRQHQFDARKEYARQVLEIRQQFDRHLKDYGQTALRSVFLLNGAAILALLTFIGSSIGKSVEGIAISPALFVPAFVKYSVGLLLTAIAMICAYFNYAGLHAGYADPGALANNMTTPQPIWPGNFSPKNNRLVNWSRWLAIVLG